MQAHPGQHAADPVHRELVLSAAKYDGPCVGRREGSRSLDRVRDRVGVRGFDRGGEARAGHLGDVCAIGELADQLVLVGAPGGGSGGPDRNLATACGGRLDRRHRTDDRHGWFEFAA